MKKTAILTMILSLLVVSFCLTASAEDLSSQVASLEQKAERIQSQINQAKQQVSLGMDAQIKALNASIDSLVKQRVQVDSHIARLETQVSELKQSADTTLNRQVQQYKSELDSVKQQISSLVAKKNAKAAQKVEAPPALSAAPAVPAESAGKVKVWAEPAGAAAPVPAAPSAAPAPAPQK